MNSHKITTRKQLQGYGATTYQARVLTQSLSPVATQGKTYTYEITGVIASIREYLQRPRIKLVTCQKLESVLEALLNQLGNIIAIPFGKSSDLEISRLAKNLIQSMAKTDQALAELKATAATIKGKYVELSPD
ncbi:hypothetical protein NDA01_16915 [Trichocoleus desertorum AS-A10]|uniref:hypothetical protein n=1 Tax=Trichocoleus desertorum TaxID=1481672 RepID=UPI003298A95E